MSNILREKIARKIEPNAWRALDTHVGGTVAEGNRADSLALADRILALPEIAEALKQSGEAENEQMRKLLGHSIKVR